MAIVEPEEFEQDFEDTDTDWGITEERDARAPEGFFESSDLNVTSTINPNRPRTWAAGFSYDREAEEGTLTVVFRDDRGGTGVWWNYYNVPWDEWEGFRSAESKGIYLRDSGMDDGKYPMGPADTGALGGFRAAQLNAIVMGARRRQIMSGGKMNHVGRPMTINLGPKNKGFGKAF
jgi:hypothetical protein